MRRLVPLAVGGPLTIGVGVLALAGCSADTKDFQEQGQQYLEGDEVRERFGMVRMSDAECAVPANTDKDTQYTCTATGSDGNTWQFTIEIAGSKALRVIQGAVVGQNAAPASTEPAGSSDPTTSASPTTAPGPSTTPAPTTAGPTTVAPPNTTLAPTTTA